MAPDIHEPSELVYLPGSSPAPILAAAGLALIGAGVFMGWIFALVGILLLIGGVRSWIGVTSDEIDHMRREQHSGTSVIPAEPVRRREHS